MLKRSETRSLGPEVTVVVQMVEVRCCLEEQRLDRLVLVLPALPSPLLLLHRRRLHRRGLQRQGPHRWGLQQEISHLLWQQWSRI